VVRDRVSRIAGGKQNPELWVAAPRLIGKLAAIHPARQSDIGKEQPDRSIGPEDTESRGTIGSFDNPISSSRKLSTTIRPHVVVVFNNENRLALQSGCWDRLRLSFRRPVNDPIGIPAQIDFYGGAFAGSL
jgi:hypothetical protein